jgi:hypothetical protein
MSKSDIAVKAIEIISIHLSAVDNLWLNAQVYILADVEIG